MDDVIGNLGEPLDFNVEHRLDDEDDAPEGSANVNADTEQQDVVVAGPSRATGVADIEACPSGSGSGNIDTDNLDIHGIMLEGVCCFVLSGCRSSLLNPFQLHLSPTPSL